MVYHRKLDIINHLAEREDDSRRGLNFAHPKGLTKNVFTFKICSMVS
jgi:hypothetical protein